ncbi:MAG: dihydrofolate reductase [Mycoplasmoidaceae bacterium]
MIKIIYCVDQKNGFANKNRLPWNIKSEMDHFKKTTLNKTIVMGSKTYEAIGRTLPKRKNIIFSRNKDLKIPNAIVTDDLDYIINLSCLEDVYVIGGIQIINLFLPYASEVIESVLTDQYHCDTFFDLDKSYFKLNKTIKYKEFKINFYQSKILSGTLLEKKIIKELILEKKILTTNNKIKPHLQIIQVGDDFASEIYVRNKIKMGLKLGIKVSHKFLKTATTTKLCKLIQSYNASNLVTGILVQLPLPANIDAKIVINSIDPIKDVDCLSEQNLGKLFNIKEDSLLPCTANAILSLLKRNQLPIAKKQVTIIGRSNIVGKPLALLLLNEDATVTICHSKTKNLKNHLKNADIIVCAVGKKDLIANPNWIKKDAIIIDVGINRDENNKICGDVNFNQLIKKAKCISPVPKGVGPLTIMMLYQNLLIAYKKQNL